MISNNLLGPGEYAALGTAVLWALSSLLYGKTRLSAWNINLGKNSIASVFLLAQLFIVSLTTGSALFSASAVAWGWLTLSGFVGIVLGDTFFFRSLQILGPRRALMMATTAPLFGIWFGRQVNNEPTSYWTIVGILISIGGICWVIADRKAKHEAPGIYPGTVFAGVTLGTVGAICTSLGFAIAKDAMRECSPLEATFIRLATSALMVALLMTAQGAIIQNVRSILHKEAFKKLLPAAMLGTWLGIWLSQIAVKHSDLAIALMLMATTPLFAIPLVRWAYGHRISIGAILGTTIATCGLALALSQVPDTRMESSPDGRVEQIDQHPSLD